MGKIVRAYGWDDGQEQRFLTINPLADEVSMYQTNHVCVSELYKWSLWTNRKDID